MIKIEHIKANLYKCPAIDNRVRHIGRLSILMFEKGIVAAEMVRENETVLISIDALGWMETPWTPIK